VRTRPYIDHEAFRGKIEAVKPRDITLDLLLGELGSRQERRFSDLELESIASAYEIFCVPYETRMRFEEDKQGPLPFTSHFLETAYYAALLGHDFHVVAACLLHDIADLEKDSSKRQQVLDDIQARTSLAVRLLVEGATDAKTGIPIKDVDKRRVFEHAISYALEYDSALVIVKGCDRLSNLRSLPAFAVAKGWMAAARVLQQTDSHYIPVIDPVDCTLARRLQDIVDSYKSLFPALQGRLEDLLAKVLTRDRAFHGTRQKKALIDDYCDFVDKRARKVGLTGSRGDYRIDPQKVSRIQRELATYPNPNTYLGSNEHMSMRFQDQVSHTMMGVAAEEWLCSRVFSFQYPVSGTSYFPPPLRKEMRRDEAMEHMREVFSDPKVFFSKARTSLGGEDIGFYYTSYFPFSNGEVHDFEREIAGLQGLMRQRPLHIFYEHDPSINLSCAKVIFENKGRDSKSYPYFVFDVLESLGKWC